MDIYINSIDIQEHCRKLGYQFSARAEFTFLFAGYQILDREDENGAEY